MALLTVACGSSTEAGTAGAGQTAGSDAQTDDAEGRPDSEAVDGAATDSTAAVAPAEADELFPDVVDVTAQLDADGTWTFAATLSSPYDTPERYADGWRVVGADGTVYGERPLTHDHQFEQPFTRSQSGIEIPEDVTEVTVQGRDQVSGWGGATVQVTLER